MTQMGQEEPFQMQTLSDREAPIPDLAALAAERGGSTGHMPLLDQLICASLQVAVPPEQVASVTIAIRTTPAR
jgi:hypothetical protein